LLELCFEFQGGPRYSQTPLFCELLAALLAANAPGVSVLDLLADAANSSSTSAGGFQLVALKLMTHLSADVAQTLTYGSKRQKVVSCCWSTGFD
jgi:hypothetical protein